MRRSDADLTRISLFAHQLQDANYAVILLPRVLELLVTKLFGYNSLKYSKTGGIYAISCNTRMRQKAVPVHGEVRL